MSRRKKKGTGRFARLHKLPFESTLVEQPNQQPAGKTPHGRAYQKMLDAEAARIRREQETPVPSQIAGMGFALQISGHDAYAAMAQALAGVIDLTKEGKSVLDLTDAKPEVTPETASAVNENVPASNAATEQQQQQITKGGSGNASTTSTDAESAHNSTQP
jgi:hypothetical protein